MLTSEEIPRDLGPIILGAFLFHRRSRALTLMKSRLCSGGGLACSRPVVCSSLPGSSLCPPGYWCWFGRFQTLRLDLRAALTARFPTCLRLALVALPFDPFVVDPSLSFFQPPYPPERRDNFPSKRGLWWVRRRCHGHRESTQPLVMVS